MNEDDHLDLKVTKGWVQAKQGERPLGTLLTGLDLILL